MIAVLGRGLSLNKYPDFCGLFDKVYMVNNFNKEIDILGLSSFENKKIIQVIGLGKDCLLTQKKYDSIDIEYIQYNRHKIKKKNICSITVRPLPDYMLNRGFPPLDWKMVLDLIDKFNDYKELSLYIRKKYKDVVSKNIKKSGCIRSWPTTGLLAIDLALAENDGDVYLFGFDLYSSDYMVKKRKPYQNSKWVKSKIMKYYLEELVKEFGNRKFYCSSKVKYNQENWINIGEQ